MPRKPHNIHYIYKTTCLITGRYYIGIHSTSNIDDGYLGSGTRLRNCIRKYGKENHIKEILEFLPDRKSLIEREIEIITSDIIKDDMCMNLTIGGQGKGGYAFKELLKHNSEFAEKWKRTCSFVMKRDYASGKRHKVFSYYWKGKHHSPETIEKIKKSLRGRGIGESNSQYGKCWIYNEKESKIIKKEELPIYISMGWKKGRRIKY